MKKAFLMLAFTGLVGSLSASAFKTTGDDDKAKKEAKKECKKGDKACCKDKAAEGKACSGEKGTAKKACCKDKAATTKMEAKPAETK